MTRQEKTYFVAIFCACFVAIADALFIFLTHDYFKLTSFCSDSGWVSCQALSHPQYSKLFGISWSVYIVLFYTFVALYTFEAFKKRSYLINIHSYVKALVVLAGLALIPTLVLSSLTIFVIKSLCPYCIVLYVTSLVLFYSSYRLWRIHRQTTEIFKFPKWTVSYVGVSIVCLIMASLFLNKSKLSGLSQSFSIDESRMIGSVSSKHTIIEFSDFQCPMCKNMAEILKNLERKEQGNVRIMYKFYPLDSSCNGSIKRKMHPWACMAARGAYCAAQSSQFWVYHDLIFQNQEFLSEDIFIEFAKMLNLDPVAFKSCMESQAAKDAVLQDIREGESQGIKGTPTLFIDGREYQGEYTEEDLQAVLHAPVS